MTAALNHQSFGNQRYGVFDAHPQPEIVVFAYGKRFIEAADPLEQILRQHHRRRTHQTKVQAARKDVTGRLSVNRLGIDSDPLPNPDFLGLANLNFRLPAHECHLFFQFPRQPKIVGIEKRDVLPKRLMYAEITRRRYPFSGRREKPQS